MVVHQEKTGTDGRQVLPDSVGVITAVEMGKPVRYHVRLSDGARVHALREDLTIRSHYQAQNLTQFHAGYLREFSLMDRIIFRCVVGSRAYGLAVDDSDTDRRGIYLAPSDLVFSLGKAPEQLENPALEFCYWELEKFILLALKANPNILECLYTPIVEIKTDLAEALLNRREMFLSKMVYQTYNGYVLSQFRKIEADLRNHGEVRWKHAMHLIRLLISGRQVLEDGFVSLRLDSFRDQLLAIRGGEWSWEDVNDLRLALHQKFEAAYQETSLPDQPDYAAANRFLIEARRSAQHEV